MNADWGRPTRSFAACFGSPTSAVRSCLPRRPSGQKVGASQTFCRRVRRARRPSLSSTSLRFQVLGAPMSRDAALVKPDLTWQPVERLTISSGHLGRIAGVSAEVRVPYYDDVERVTGPTPDLQNWARHFGKGSTPKSRVGSIEGDTSVIPPPSNAGKGMPVGEGCLDVQRQSARSPPARRLRVDGPLSDRGGPRQCRRPDVV
jgi:hypothetical protein